MTDNKIIPTRKTHFKLSVQYDVPFDKLAEFVETVKPYARFTNNFQFSGCFGRNKKGIENRNRRIDLILSNLQNKKEIRIGSLFLSLKATHNYPYTYRTLQRDIMEMGIRGLITSESTGGGKQGNTTIITPIKSQFNQP